jgi:lipoprotein-anchoring transpeptidase ErfK/SrfK
VRGWRQRIEPALQATDRALQVVGRGLECVTGGRVRSVSRRVAAGALLIVVAGIVVPVVSLSGSGPTPAPRTVANTHPQQSTEHEKVMRPVHVPARRLKRLPAATTFTTTPRAPSDPTPFARTSGVVVHPLTALVVYSAPGKAPVAVLPSTQLGGPTWVPVIQTSPGWDRVLLPSKPNGRSGWIYIGGQNATVLDTGQSPYVIRIRVAQRKLTLIKNGHALKTWRVAVGAHGTPTPTGRTFVLAMLAPASPTYSPLIIPLGFHSRTLDTFGGGPGTVAVHGWPDPSVFGHAVSHGCVRVPDVALRLLRQVPLGSLVKITG